MKQILLLFLFLFSLTIRAQSPFDSQSVVKYDIFSHSTDKPIPFDAPFTLLLEKNTIKNITHVYAYQTEFKNGVRSVVLGKYYDAKKNIIDNQAVYDVDLKFEEKNESVYIYFGPLKPGILFDLLLERELSETCSKELLKVNVLLAQGACQIDEAKKQFGVLQSCTVDKMNNQTAFAMGWDEYQSFFANVLAADYSLLSSPPEQGGTLSVLETSAACQLMKYYRGCDVLFEAARRDCFKNICDGTVSINDIFKEKETALYDADQRIVNLTANQVFFEDLIKRMTSVEASGRPQISIEGTVVKTEKLRASVSAMYFAVNKNIKWLQKSVDKRNSIIKKNTKIREVTSLAGNTVSSDLKSASGRVLFGDMGLSTIFAQDLRNETAVLPALHLGFSIYFRSIDKNTRYSRFRCGMYPKRVKIHERDSLTGMPGPDYEIMTRPDILQHLSLSVGITVSSFTNNEFDNFYKSNSLLVGPAYRIYRGFKISSGAAFLRRTSSNPLISEKKVVVGAYVSLSVDIDFLSGIEKVTSIVFK